MLRGAGLALEGLAFDLHLGSFLCDATRNHSLEALARDVLGVALEPIEPPEKRGAARAGLETLAVEGAAVAAGRAAACLFPLAAALTAQLEAREQWPLYRDLEHPLIGVLYRMERAGVALESAVLAQMSAEAGVEITRLERELGELAGEPVNLNSGPQIAKLLFEKFKLKPGRRTKTGYSTDSEVLETLAGEHAFARLLLEYRALTKLKSTYFDALPAERDPGDGRVHTTFEQTGAATGRLSSSDPNLQNIPMRTPQGRAIRRAFVAAPGSVLVGADYSQIELRVMAHLVGRSEPDRGVPERRGRARQHGAAHLRRGVGRARPGASRARQDRELRRHVRNGCAQPGAADGDPACRCAGVHRRLLFGVRRRARLSGPHARGGAGRGWVATLLGAALSALAAAAPTDCSARMPSAPPSTRPSRARPLTVKLAMFATPN